MADTQDDVASMDIAVDLDDAHAYELARMRHSLPTLLGRSLTLGGYQSRASSRSSAA